MSAGRKRPKKAKRDDTDVVQPDLTNLRLRNPVSGGHFVEAASGAVGGLLSKRPHWVRGDEHNKSPRRRRRGGDTKPTTLVGTVLVGGRIKRA